LLLSGDVNGQVAYHKYYGLRFGNGYGMTSREHCGYEQKKLWEINEVHDGWI
jgi:hypothetical protein